MFCLSVCLFVCLFVFFFVALSPDFLKLVEYALLWFLQRFANVSTVRDVFWYFKLSEIRNCMMKGNEKINGSWPSYVVIFCVKNMSIYKCTQQIYNYGVTWLFRKFFAFLFSTQTCLSRVVAILDLPRMQWEEYRCTGIFLLSFLQHSKYTSRFLWPAVYISLIKHSCPTAQWSSCRVPSEYPYSYSNQGLRASSLQFTFPLEFNAIFHDGFPLGLKLNGWSKIRDPVTAKFKHITVIVTCTLLHCDDVTYVPALWNFQKADLEPYP